MMVKYPEQRGIICDPTLDGVTHINVGTKGRTKLGLALGNMARIRVNIPDHGQFDCIEGYWWFASTGFMYPEFKSLNGFEARKKGKSLERVPDPRFEEWIKEALTLKLRENRWILDELTDQKNALPLCHYYVYGIPPNCKVHPANKSLWILDHFETIREQGGVKSLGGSV